MGSISLGELSEHLAANGLANAVEGDDGVVVTGVNTLEDAGPGEISFLANPRYRDRLATTKASAALVDREVTMPSGVAAIRSDDPYAALCMAIVKIHGHRKHPQWGLSEQANISPSAKIGAGANVGPGVNIADDVTIGAGATIYPGCFIGPRCTIGDQVTLYPNVVIYDGSILGHRVTIHSGTVIGEDGLGYAPVDERWVKIPQVGQVAIADDVEIGANCTVDRATLGRTEIGSGTKFSNLIAIGHGTKIGQDCLLVAQVGVAGSATVGRHVTVAGQAGIVGHLTIGDNAAVGAQAGVTNDVEPGITVLGSPALPITEAKRHMLMVQRLPEMRQRLKDLAEEVEALGEQVRSEK
ncbi:MAG: UDP-3-O-(3-hydroxymyristoyl)glucosamine N-acyltransferase [Planctomycetota bacterium]